MITQPRALLMLGVVLWALAGITYVTLRATYGQRPALIHVRWAPSIDDATRESVVRGHALIEGVDRGNRTWAYYLTDLSTENIRSLIQNPAVEDTHYLHRTQFRIGWRNPPRGEYQTTRSRSLASLMEFVTEASVVLGAVALALGAVKTWWARRGALTGRNTNQQT